MPGNSPVKKLSLREKVAFYLEDTQTNLGLYSDLSILGLILLSSAIFVAQTYPISQQLENILGLLDLAILIVFTCEYILRFWSAENPRKFFFSFFSLIDLISILPLLLGWMDIRFLRVFRWFRIVRIVRFWKIEKRLLGIANEDSIVFVRIFLTLFTLIFVYAGLIYQVEHQINSDRLKNFFDAFYFVVVTMTTVGYGDVTPLSQAGRVMTLLMIFTGVLFIPWQLSELIGQVVKTSNLVEQKCSNCKLSRHDPDALFCKQCGVELSKKNRTLSEIILEEK
ncbi:ion transporter [Waterburya agarophytonicola K14]|uniref:Ion transporter n=1 Tax=Waterburya agarophytonicola KI4 TaxID=2874699 RepID=A0A964FEV7_9CYAN|nr:ion transporter [Waterburya agarophytonicola KI4]